MKRIGASLLLIEPSDTGNHTRYVVYDLHQNSGVSIACYDIEHLCEALQVCLSNSRLQLAADDEEV